MSEQQFPTEKAYQNHLHKQWYNDLKTLVAQRGQEYFDQLTQGLSLILGADRVFVGSFDLELSFGTTISDYHAGQFRDNYEFHVPGTPYEAISRGKSLLVEDDLPEFFVDTDAECFEGHSGVIGRAIFDDNNIVVGLIVILFSEPVKWIHASNSLIDLCIVSMSSEMNTFFKSRQLNEMNHQLLRELALSNQLKEELGRLAFVDRVTGLANREQFIVDVEERENLDECWIALSGIDCFKPVNESMGLESGDILLKDIGENISNLGIIGTSVYKWTGDEFMTLGSAKNPGDIKETIRLCDLVFQQPFDVNKSMIRITRSTGVTKLSDHDSIDDAIKAVCIAMQRAKMRGGNGQYAVFQDSYPHAGRYQKASVYPSLSANLRYRK